MPRCSTAACCIGLLLVLFVATAQAEAPSASRVEGVLVDKQSGQPVAGAPVQLDRGPVVISDNKGRFVFEGIASGRHELWVQDPEHVPLQVNIFSDAANTRELRFALDPVGKEEQVEVVVRSQRLKSEVTDTVVQVDEVKKIPGTQGDVGKIIQSLPGVARGLGFSTGTAGPGLLIQGAAPEDSKALIDGHVVPLLYHFGGLTSVLNSDMLKSMDFMPSGFGVEFGQAIGGIIDVQTRAPSRKGISGYVNASLLDTGFFVEGSLTDSLGYMAAARRSTVDLWLPSILANQEGFDLTVAPVYYDYQAKVDWTPLAGHRFSVLGYGSSDEMKLLIEKAISGDATMRGNFLDQIQFHRLQLGWDYTPDPAWEVRGSLVGGYDQYHFQVGDDRFVKAWMSSLSGRFDAELQPNQTWYLHTGLYFSTWNYRVSLRFPRPPKEGEIPSNFENMTLLEGNEDTLGLAGALYVMTGWRVHKSSLLSGGFRLEGFGDPLDQLALMPRFSLKQELRTGTNLSASGGLYYQPPAGDEMSKSFGTPTVRMERAWHFNLRLQQEVPELLSIDIGLFYKIIDQMVVSDVQQIYANHGQGKISGLQAMIRRDLKDGLFGWMAYTLMRSLRKDGPDQPWRLFDYDQTHILTVVAGYQLPTGPVVASHGQRSGWDFGLRFQLVSGNPITPMLGGIFDADYDSYLPIPGPINSQRLPLYHRLDLRVDYTWAFSRWALSVFLDLQNVYNYRSIEGVQYNYDYSQRAYFKGLPILPALGIKGCF